jgi:hypothetical protein
MIQPTGGATNSSIILTAVLFIINIGKMFLQTMHQLTLENKK